MMYIDGGHQRCPDLGKTYCLRKREVLRYQNYGIQHMVFRELSSKSSPLPVITFVEPRMSPHDSPKPRAALVERATKETIVQVSLCIDGGPLDLLPNDAKFASISSIPAQNAEHHATQAFASQTIWIWTGIGFLDHLLHALAKHGGWSLRVRCNGDLASKLSPRDRLLQTPRI